MITANQDVYAGPYIESAAFNPSLSPLQAAIIVGVIDSMPCYTHVSCSMTVCVAADMTVAVSYSRSQTSAFVLQQVPARFNSGGRHLIAWLCGSGSTVHLGVGTQKGTTSKSSPNIACYMAFSASLSLHNILSNANPATCISGGPDKHCQTETGQCPRWPVTLSCKLGGNVHGTNVLQASHKVEL